MRRIEFAIQITNWLSRQDDFSPIHALCLMCISADGQLSVENMLKKIKGVSEIDIRDAIIDLEKHGYIECDYSKKIQIGSPKCACWLSARGSIVISKIFNLAKKDAA